MTSDSSTHRMKLLVNGFIGAAGIISGLLGISFFLVWGAEYLLFAATGYNPPPQADLVLIVIGAALIGAVWWIYRGGGDDG